MDNIALSFDAQMFVRLVVATILGAMVGYEREKAGKEAGMRTYSMVSLGATLFTLVSVYGFGSGDPGRVAAQIVSGVGFLGAGAILHRRGSIHGLTTAATLWVTAAIGLSVGIGMELMAVATTVLIFLLLRFGPRSTPSQGRLKEKAISKEESE